MYEYASEAGNKSEIEIEFKIKKKQSKCMDLRLQKSYIISFLNIQYSNNIIFS